MRVQEVTEFVLSVIEEKTGYPQEMLEPDLDLEADLGIDSVKQVEIFAKLREGYGLPFDPDLKLKNLNTIAKIVEFLVNAQAAVVEPVMTEEPDASAKLEELAQGQEAGVTRRYIPLTLEQPLPTLIPENTFSFRDKGVVVIADREGKVAGHLVPALEGQGARVFTVLPQGLNLETGKTFSASFDQADSLQAAFAAVGQEGTALQVVINLYPLVQGFSLYDVTEQEWEGETERQFNVNFLAAKAFYSALQNLASGEGGYFAATNMGGVFGMETSAGPNPLGGITSGFIKSLGKELPALATKVVDFPVEERPEKVAEILLQEMERMEAHVEIGYTVGGRKIIQVLPVPLDSELQHTPLQLDSNSVILASGGGRGIILECLKGLSEFCRPHIILTGRTEAPAGDEEWLHLGEEELTRYRQNYMKKLKQENPSLSPLLAERESRKFLYARELYRNLQELKKSNPNVYYEVCDIADGKQVGELVTRIKERWGKIDGVIHGAGLESFGTVPKKPEAYSRNVVRVKVNGFRHLWAATKDEPLKFFVNFGSISGRFGMDGQVDYCAGADAVAKCSYLQARGRGSLRAFTIDWTAWADTGMAAQAIVRKAQEEERGLAYMGIQEGVDRFLRELFLGGENPEVMFFGELGKNSPLGQMDSLEKGQIFFPARPDGLVVDRVRFPFLERIESYRAGEAVTATKRLLQQQDFYLGDHLVEGDCTFPGVMHVESQWEAASLLCPDLHLAKVEKVEFLKFIKYFERNPLSLRIRAQVSRQERDQAEVQAEIRSDFVNSKGMVLERDRLHSQGQFLLTRERPEAPAVGFDARELMGRGQVMDLNKFYRRASRLIEFGPLFQALREVRYLGEGEMISEAVVTPHKGLFSYVEAPRLLTAPVVIDNACRSILLWSFHHTGEVIVPRIIEDISIYRVPLVGEKVYAHARFLDYEGDLHRFQVQLLDQENRLLMNMGRLTLIKVDREDGDTSLF